MFVYSGCQGWHTLTTFPLNANKTKAAMRAGREHREDDGRLGSGVEGGVGVILDFKSIFFCLRHKGSTYCCQAIALDRICSHC